LNYLKTVAVTVPSVKGTILVDHSLSSTKYELKLTSPAGTNAIVGIPKKFPWKSVSVGDKCIWNEGIYGATGGISSAGEDSLYIKFSVDPGVWHFTASLIPVGISQQPKQVMSNSRCVNIRKITDNIVFESESAGDTKLVKVYTLSGRLVFSKTVLSNKINLQKDFGLPINVYIVKIKIAKEKI
jgi:hypothetical protein